MPIGSAWTQLQKLTDGGGLRLWVQPTGAHCGGSLMLRRQTEAARDWGLSNSFLARARQAREDARRLLADGSIPRSRKGARPRPLANAPTFRGIADEYVAKLRRENRSDATIAKIEWLLSFANAEFGDEPSARSRLRPSERCCSPSKPARDLNRARRLRSTMGSVF